MLMVINGLPVVSDVFNFVLGGLIKKARRSHFKYCTDRVDRRLAIKTTRPDFWTQVLRREGDASLSLAEMHSNADLFMIAGTETSATLVSGLIYYLLTNPEKMTKLQEELRSEFKSLDEITMARLIHLKYLNACIEEGLRVYSPVPVGLPRRAPAPGVAVCGEWIPGGVSTAVNLSL
jgi:cytochrome P450